MWLIAVITSVVTGLVTILLVACVAALCYRCHKNRPQASFKITPPLPSAHLEDLKDTRSVCMCCVVRYKEVSSQ